MKLTNERLLIPYRFFFRLEIALYPTDNSNSTSLFYNCQAVVDKNKYVLAQDQHDMPLKSRKLYQNEALPEPNV